MCDPPLVFAILETLTILRRACEREFTDEVKKILYLIRKNAKRLMVYLSSMIQHITSIRNCQSLIYNYLTLTTAGMIC